MSEIAVKKRKNRIGDPAGDRVLKVVVVTLVTLLTLTCVLTRTRPSLPAAR